MPRFVRYLAPLVAFLALAGLLYKGLSLDPRKVPSPLIDKPAPAFSLTRLKQPEAMLGTAWSEIDTSKTVVTRQPPCIFFSSPLVMPMG